jgi:hypothetical protein
MTYTLEGKNLGIVTNERNEENTEQMSISVPDGSSVDVEIIPILGNTRNVIIQGIYKGLIDELKTFVAQLHTWVENFGKINTKAISYASDLLGTIDVKVLGGSWGWEAGNPNSINYELKLAQAKKT